MPSAFRHLPAASSTGCHPLTLTRALEDFPLGNVPLREHHRRLFDKLGVAGPDVGIIEVNPHAWLDEAEVAMFLQDRSASALQAKDGLVAVMNDLHKGRDSDKSWKWVIDVSAVFLVLVSLSGLLIQLFQRKRRTRALIVAAAGLLLTVVFIWFAVQ